MSNTLIKQLSNALGPHGDLELTRSALVMFLRRNTDPREAVEVVRVWLESEQLALPHDRWFQRVALAWLNSQRPTDRMGPLVDRLEAEVLPPTPAQRLEQRAARFLVPGIRHRLLVAARKARLRERAVGVRF